MKAKYLLILITAFCSIAPFQVSHAGTIGYGDLTLETMMNVQSVEQMLVYSAINWNYNDTATYNYTYNTSTGAFSFYTIPDQFVSGLMFNFSLTAQLNMLTGIWSWSGTGFSGATSFLISGYAVTDLDPEDITGTYTDANGKEYKATATVDITISPVTKVSISKGTGQVTNANGDVVIKGKVTDATDLNNNWLISFDDEIQQGLGFKTSGNDTSTISPTEFSGSFTQTAVPEPSSLVLLYFGVISLIGYSLLSRRQRNTL